MFIYSHDNAYDKSTGITGRSLVNVILHPVYISQRKHDNYGVLADKYLLAVTDSKEKAWAVADRIFKAIVEGKTFLDLQAED